MFWKFSYLIMKIMKLYVVRTHKNRLIEAILMSTHNIHVFIKVRRDIPKSSPFVSRPGTMINPRWLELPISWTNFHGPKGVRGTEVVLSY